MGHKYRDSFGTRGELRAAGEEFTFFRLTRLHDLGLADLEKLPFSIRILLENALRNEDGSIVKAEHVEALARWSPKATCETEIPFMPSRVILQDFTGVPAIVDLAAMRDATERLGGRASLINPLVPADLIIDHSVQVDSFGSPEAAGENVKKEYERNAERYALLKWAQGSFRGLRVVPPGMGIIHQVNLEYLASVVRNDSGRAYPDTVVGTDSHTTMINALAVLGWGVGGIEAEAVMLGRPYYMLIPEVVGFKLTGSLREGVTATDLVLTVTQMLRARGVVGAFVEFFGPGLSSLSLADRATLANMAPEYGATMGFFPVDSTTLSYLRLTGRSEEHIALVEAYCKEQCLFRTDQTPDPVYSEVLQLDMGEVEPSLAGPKRPQDRLSLRAVKHNFQKSLVLPAAEGGWGLGPEELRGTSPLAVQGGEYRLTHGSVVIAAITSCTNTSNPSVMLAAGLVARKAHKLGLRRAPWVKTSLAPGSRVVTDYLKRAGLLEDLEALGFHLVGYGCTTCIGNSGPLAPGVEEAIKAGGLVVASVLSGNRNFEGRIHSAVKANYLASPPLVVAYAIAGRIDIDLENEPLAEARDGTKVYLRDIWPSFEEIEAAGKASLSPDLFRERYKHVFEGDELWRKLPSSGGGTFDWDQDSTYIRRPPFFEDMPLEPPPLSDLTGARVLALLGDSITTDHISPAGAIPEDSPAGRYLMERGVRPEAFNTYGSRRGNHEVMVRGTFANIRLRNLLVPATEGGWTIHFPSGEKLSIYDAAVRYRAEGVPLIVIAGSEYGTGSSRDWAAKGTALLGVKAVLARSFERIHRSNLIGMGVLPLQFTGKDSWQSLSLTGKELYEVRGIEEGLEPGKLLEVTATDPSGSAKRFSVRCRLDSPIEVEYYRHGGILQAVLRNMLKENSSG